jgi:hypothetical protein
MGNTRRRAGLPIGRSGADTRDMSPDHIGTLRVAAVAETGVVAELLDAFNGEYDTPTPGPAVLSFADRLRPSPTSSELLDHSQVRTTTDI